MLDRAIGAALDAGIKRPILVLGASAEDILKNLKRANSCEVVLNKEYTQGQASSLKTGVKKLSRDCRAAIFLLCDQPLVDGTLITELITAFVKNKPDILYPTYLKQRGNPVIINRSLFARLLTATGDKGARFLFSDNSLKLLAYPVETPAVLMDIDSPEEYSLIIESSG